ncbi:TPA: hypothetical protein LNR20_004888, partial [Salmonella enterica subsp. enterica serovar Typhimurium]|nr:hypothetical protein [Salmonella enterica subsp. enterica serovar Typhimurium]
MDIPGIGSSRPEGAHRILQILLPYLTSNKWFTAQPHALNGVDFIPGRVNVPVVNAVLLNRCYFNFLLTRSGKQNGFGNAVNSFGFNF